MLIIVAGMEPYWEDSSASEKPFKYAALSVANDVGFALTIFDVTSSMQLSGGETFGGLIPFRCKFEFLLHHWISGLMDVLKCNLLKGSWFVDSIRRVADVSSFVRRD